MSRTINIGVHKKGYYGYMATVMFERLQVIIREQAINEDSISSGVLRAAERFFDSACEAFEKKIPKNPLASINDYKIACESIGVALQIGHGKYMKQQLASYKKMIHSLQKPRVLTSQECILLEDMVLFFKELGDVDKRF